MKELFKEDFVIYDRANDHVKQFSAYDYVIQFSGGGIVIYGDENEALIDCRGNEIVIPCTELPEHWKNILLTQINNEL
jgi:hypothetical protein